MIKINTCPVCQSQKIEVLKNDSFSPPTFINDDVPPIDCTYPEERLWILFKNILKTNTKADFAMSLCGDCGFIFTNPRYELGDIETKYSTVSALPSAKKRKENSPPKHTEKRAARIYNLLEKYPPKNYQSVLDYGGAEGYNLSQFVKAKKRCGVIDQVHENLISGVEFLGKDFSEPSHKFDCILLCHTLEHIPEPVEYLKEISTHLSDDGVIYIEVPLGAWKEFSRIKEPLTHVNFFSEEALFNVAKKAGLNVLHLSTNYQWITHYNLWCINMVCTKKEVGELVNALSTKSQMLNRKYQLLMALKEPSILLKWLKKKLVG
ncbi:MAG: class I SAM-dependent methyltransferase [Bacteroidetes bacterium]|nr:class I SAM-dependent methyltransferase [Bacteroidota bacterium]